MENCIFCKIIAGEIPAKKVHEDSLSFAFLDIRPRAPGHTLLIPKEHYVWFQDTPDEVSDDLFRTAKRLAKKMKEQYKADFIQLGISGQDVPHVHIHLIPRTLAGAPPEL